MTTAPHAPDDPAVAGDPQGAGDSARVRRVRVHLHSLIRNLAEQGQQRLPPERDLAERFGVSRPTLRRALDGLEEAGLLWRHVGRGTFIAPQENRISLTLPPVAVTLADVMEARQVLETASAAAAARRADAAMVTRLQALARQAREADSWRAYELADTDFHLELARAGGNAVLAALFEGVEVIRRGATLARQRPVDRPPADHHSFAEHDRIIAAIAAGDADGAQAAMAQHLRTVAARFAG